MASVGDGLLSELWVEFGIRISEIPRRTEHNGQIIWPEKLAALPLFDTTASDEQSESRLSLHIKEACARRRNRIQADSGHRDAGAAYRLWSMLAAKPLVNYVIVLDKLLICIEKGRPIWTVPVSQIDVVGEYTIATISAADDWFFVVVTSDGGMHVASMSSAGLGKCFSDLAAELGGVFEQKLSGSVNWKHRVIWPKVIEGRDLFRADKLELSECVLDYIASTRFGP